MKDGEGQAPDAKKTDAADWDQAQAQSFGLDEAVSETPQLQYESNPKHSEPWQAGRKGSICPKEVRPHAQKLLEGSELVGRQRYAVHAGKAYCAKQHRDGVWHGYPVGWSEVPPVLVNKWRREKLVSKRDLDRYWGGHS